MRLIALSLLFWLACTTSVESLNCFGHQCDSHKSKCIVHGEHGLTGRCEDAHMCHEHSTCTTSNVHAHGPHHECCCETQDCIDNLKVAQASSLHLTCFGHSCDSFREGCLVANEHDRLTGWCEPLEGCRHHSACTAPHHGREHECCCTDQHCIDNLSGSSSQQSSSASLHCGHVTCWAHSTHPYCKLHNVGGRLEGECIEHRICGDHHHKLCQTSHDKYGHGGCCCQDSSCIATVTGVTTAAPATHGPVQHKTTVQQQTTQSQATGKPTMAPTTNGPSMLLTTAPAQPVTSCPPFDLTCPAGCATYDVKLCPICDMTSPDCVVQGGSSSTMAPVVTSTPMATTPKVCQDVDLDNCVAMHDALCTSTNANIHHLAVVTCAKSCGFCDEYLGIDTKTTQAPPAPTTKPIVTTTQKVCADVDPDNCARMQGALCPTTDPNLHHMAVTTCAKTCNLCAEFMLL